MPANTPSRKKCAFLDKMGFFVLKHMHAHILHIIIVYVVGKASEKLHERWKIALAVGGWLIIRVRRSHGLSSQNQTRETPVLDNGPVRLKTRSK